MRKLIKLSLLLLFSLILLFAVFLSYSTFVDYQPDKEIEVLKSIERNNVIKTKFKVMTWNIGYAGLGAGMDFFYGGGKQVRTSREQTLENLNQITNFIMAQKDVDFFLFQEVDVEAKRTYYINEMDSIKRHIPAYGSTYADNYLVQYVPVPFYDPLGSVKSGLQNSSKLIPFKSTRHGFPGNYDWPKRIFMLDRGFLVDRHKLPEGNELLIINTHNSAFDNGSIKLQQIEYLIKFLQAEVEKGNLFVVGGDWNQNPPGLDGVNFENHYDSDKFELSSIDGDLFPSNWNWSFDNTIPTVRSNSKPYQKNVTSTTVLDFFLTSPGLKIIDVWAVDLDFQHSDHQPVFMDFELIKTN